MRDLGIFRSLVKREVKFIRSNNFLDADDIEQECWMKIWSIIPKFQHIPEVELRAIVSKSLVNHRNDMFRKNRIREHINIPLNLKPKDGASQSSGDENGSFEDTVITLQNMKFIGSTPSHMVSPEDACSYSRLVNQLLEWSNGQSELTQKIVKAMVDPDDDLLAKWHDSIKDNVSRYRYYYHIPPSSLAKHFGVSKLVISRTVKKIRLFLIDADLVGENTIKQYEKYHQEWKNATVI